jgi:hypothetical protein
MIAALQHSAAKTVFVIQSQFRHSNITKRVVQSTCCFCHKTIAYAPNDKLVRIADRAHICQRLR